MKDPWNDFGQWLLGYLIGTLIMAACWAGLGIHQCDCVKHGAAHYDPQTGAFTWNEQVVKREAYVDPVNGKEIKAQDYRLIKTEEGK